MIIRSIDTVPKEKVTAGKNTYRQILIGPGEAPHFAMRRFIIAPGGEMPNHTNSVEHEQLVLGGRAEVGIGGRVLEVKKNDVVFIPANVPHWYRALGEEPFEFLCMVPNQEDIITLVTADAGG